MSVSAASKALWLKFAHRKVPPLVALARVVGTSSLTGGNKRLDSVYVALFITLVCFVCFFCSLLGFTQNLRDNGVRL